MSDPRQGIIVDCDPGIDDALALLYLALHPAVDLVGVTTVHGNVPAPVGAENALKTLEVAGAADIPVAIGVNRPLARMAATAEDIHGQDGLGDVGLGPPRRLPDPGPGPLRILEWVRARPGELTLLAIGPVTNLAVALLLDGELPRLIRRLVVMGGAVHVPGNTTRAAEFNIWHDPEAAHVVFSAPWPLTLVGLDVTRQALLAGAPLERLENAGGPVPCFASAILGHYLRLHEQRRGIRAAVLHDPLAAALAVDPSLATYEQTGIQVELDDPEARGATRPVKAPAGGPRHDVAVGLDRERFLSAFVGLLTGGPAPG